MSVSVLTLTAIAYDRFKGSIFWSNLEMRKYCFEPSNLPTTLTSVIFNSQVFYILYEKELRDSAKLNTILIFTICRHVAQLLAIWLMSGLLALPEAMMLHAVSSFKEQPCIRWAVTMENGKYLSELFVSDDIMWDLTNCVPFWSYNTGLAYGVLKTVILFVSPLIFMIVLYINIINKLWNSDKIEGYDWDDIW